MTREERRDFSQQLEILSKEAEGLPVPLAIDNGIIIPPVHLTIIPLVKYMLPYYILSLACFITFNSIKSINSESVIPQGVQVGCSSSTHETG
jgi:hypothetical protein